MAQKSNYSEVQKLDRNATLKKIVIIIAVLVLLFVAVTIFRIFNGSSNSSSSSTKTQESASLTMVPTTTYYYDPQAEKSYNVGVNYVIISDGNDGYLKVASTGEVTRVSSDGTYLKDATTSETASALQIAQTIIDKDNSASIALAGLDTSAVPVEETNTVEIVEKTAMDELYDAVLALGYTEEQFNKQLTATGSNANAAVTLINAGADPEKLVKSIMSQSTTTTTATASDTSTTTSLTANIENLGSIVSEEVGTGVSSSSDESSYPSWLQDTDTTASMTAVLDSLASIASSGNSTTTSTWESTNKQAEKNSWLSDQQSTETTATKLTRYDLVAGTTVPITIVTGVNTDIPGQVIGLVRQDVYDTLTGTNIIIPKGSRLLATYNSSVSFGQSSIQIAWTTLITTDGYQFTLPGFNGTDPEGYAGVSGKVNNHFWSMLGGAVLGSFIDWGAAYATSKAQTLVSGETLSELVSALSGSVIDTTSNVGQQYASMWASLQPTIKIKTGTQTQLLVNQTVSLKRPSSSYVTNSF